LIDDLHTSFPFQQRTYEGREWMTNVLRVLILAGGRQHSSLLKRTLIALRVGLRVPTSPTILARGAAAESRHFHLLLCREDMALTWRQSRCISERWRSGGRVWEHSILGYSRDAGTMRCCYERWGERKRQWGWKRRWGNDAAGLGNARAAGDECVEAEEPVPAAVPGQQGELAGTGWAVGRSRCPPWQWRSLQLEQRMEGDGIVMRGDKGREEGAILRSSSSIEQGSRDESKGRRSRERASEGPFFV
jgi:hypothetical protein